MISIYRWSDILRQPTWPIQLRSEIEKYVVSTPECDGDRKFRWALYELVEAMLLDGTIALENIEPEGPRSLDGIEFVVVHHSGTAVNVSHSRLSAMGLLRLYVPAYWARLTCRPAEARLGSGHYRKDRQVFYAYHWLIRPDGTQERLLLDAETGWHSGNWSVNLSSVAVCLAGDYSTSRPNEECLESVRAVCARYRVAKVRPHCLFNVATTCPGPWMQSEVFPQ